MVDSLASWLAALNPALLYTALAVSSFLENIVPPVPGDSVVLFGSYLAARTHMSFTNVLIATTLGSEAGFMTYYLLGRLIDPARLAARGYRFIPTGKIEQAHRWFVRWGLGVVLLNRFLSGVRSVISIVSGMSRLPWPRVLLLSTIACLMWNLILVRAGFILGSNWQLVETILTDYNRVVLATLAVALVAWVLVRRIRRPSPGPGSPHPGDQG